MELKKEVDEDLARFDVWFQKQGNDPLTGAERAILATYLWWKTQIEKE